MQLQCIPFQFENLWLKEEDFMFGGKASISMVLLAYKKVFFQLHFGYQAEGSSSNFEILEHKGFRKVRENTSEALSKVDH